MQLPNGDLWRGYRDTLSEVAMSETEIVSLESQDPVNKAMASILKAAKGAKELSCLWCGHQADERATRAHIKTNHAISIGLDKPSDAQVLVAQLAETKAALTEATKQSE